MYRKTLTKRAVAESHLLAHARVRWVEKFGLRGVGGQSHSYYGDVWEESWLCVDSNRSEFITSSANSAAWTLTSPVLYTFRVSMFVQVR